MAARTISAGIGGLDLILGGGIRVLKRGEALDESTTILLRGPPGSGKTVLGLALAGALAHALGGHVAYGCVELLPSELAAQHTGIMPEALAESVVLAEPAGERGSLRFPPQQGTAGERRIFAATLDIGEPGEEQQRITPAILGLLDGVRQAGGAPRVLVVDSLSDGYHLGAQAPRVLSDELCKMAVQQGIVLLMLEEIAESRPSAWSFAADVVIELGHGEGEALGGPSTRRERQLSVLKNRFGPSEAGRHPFVVGPRAGVQVLPQPWAYLSSNSSWAYNDILAQPKPLAPPAQEWLEGWTAPPGWPQFRECITLVSTTTVDVTYEVASHLGATAEGFDLFLDFGRLGDATHTAPRAPSVIRIDCGDPFLRGHRLLPMALSSVDAIRTKREPLRRVLIGDLRVLRIFHYPEELRRTLIVFTSILRRLVVPALYFETFEPRGGIQHMSEIRLAPMADVVDVTAASSARGRDNNIHLSLTVVRSGLHAAIKL
jgi:KaiC/GvpD/RAD55 family RecA-like ATPase